MTHLRDSQRPARCLALFSGMLDSILAVEFVRRQGIAVDGLHFATPWSDHGDWVHQAADRLSMPLKTITLGDDYWYAARHPRFGRGPGLSPCVDCRLHWLRIAARRLASDDADFVITGEVLGQKAFGQRREDLEAMADHSGLGDRLVRPLSARRLPVTWPENAGLLDRQRLGDLVGNSRAELLKMGQAMGWSDAPSGGDCCRLAQRAFAARAGDLWKHHGQPSSWDYQLLHIGRHFRISERAKAVVAKNAAESARLIQLHGQQDAAPSVLMRPANFAGPSALLVGPPLPGYLQRVWGLVRRWGRVEGDELEGWIELEAGSPIRVALGTPPADAQTLWPIGRAAEQPGPPRFVAESGSIE